MFNVVAAALLLAAFILPTWAILFRILRAVREAERQAGEAAAYAADRARAFGAEVLHEVGRHAAALELHGRQLDAIDRAVSATDHARRAGGIRRAAELYEAALRLAEGTGREDDREAAFAARQVWLAALAGAGEPAPPAPPPGTTGGDEAGG